MAMPLSTLPLWPILVKTLAVLAVIAAAAVSNPGYNIAWIASGFPILFCTALEVIVFNLLGPDANPRPDTVIELFKRNQHLVLATFATLWLGAVIIAWLLSRILNPLADRTEELIRDLIDHETQIESEGIFLRKLLLKVFGASLVITLTLFAGFFFASRHVQAPWFSRAADRVLVFFIIEVALAALLALLNVALGAIAHFVLLMMRVVLLSMPGLIASTALWFFIRVLATR